MSQALVLLAYGCEDVEAVTVLDVLHRGGVGVFGAAVGSRQVVECAHNTRIKPQYAFAPEDGRYGGQRWCYHYDAIVVPGGMGGTLALAGHPGVLAELREADARGCVVAAVCAGPMVLDAAGVLAGRRYCCYPGIEKRISSAGAVYVPDVPTVTDGNLVTGTGPGTAALFALAVLEALEGRARRDEVARGMLLA